MLKLLRLLALLALSTCLPSSMPCKMITVEDYENYAKQRLPLAWMEYLQRGADKETTLDRNIEAFSKIRVIPRYLIDVSNRTTSAEAFGKKFKLPIGISPSAFQKSWHPEGELATIRASQSAGTIMIVSLGASNLLEDIAKEAPETEKWLQIYLCTNKTVSYDLVKRAEDSGFEALVVTVDRPVQPIRYYLKKNEWKVPDKMVNYQPYIEANTGPLTTDTATWEYLAELINSTTLPVVVKGVMTPGDARLAYQHGAKGVIVSNHGGRQIDGTISTIEALANIVKEFPEATHPGFEIYLDSGIRSGLDVFKALAMGAKYVFVGRAPMWGLFHSGQQGVEAVLEILRNELETLMGQTGCNTLEEINPSLIQYNFSF